MKKKTSITLDDNTLKDLDRMAKNSHRSRSGMISFLVDLFKITIDLGQGDHNDSQSKTLEG